MPLTLRAISLNDLPITQPIARPFGAQGGSIGRADSNTLALPDPERRISRRQAEVLVRASGYVIKNVGSANPIIVRDQSLALGESAPLRGGDQVRIGGYLLEVKADDAASDDRDRRRSLAPRRSIPSLPPDRRAAARGACRRCQAFVWRRSAPAFPPSSPFADLGAPVSTGNPFAELLGDSSTARVELVAREQLAAAARAACPTTSILSRRLPSPRRPAAPRASTSAAGGAFEDLIPSAAPASIDSLFGLTRRRLARSVGGLHGGRRRRRRPEQGKRSDRCRPIRSRSSEPRRTPRRSRPSAPTVPDHTPELRAGFAPPKIAQPRPRPSEPLPARCCAARCGRARRACGPIQCGPRRQPRARRNRVRPRLPATRPLPTVKNPPSPPPSAGPPTPSRSGTPSAKAPASASIRRPTPAPPSCASSA